MKYSDKEKIEKASETCEAVAQLEKIRKHLKENSKKDCLWLRFDFLQKGWVYSNVIPPEGKEKCELDISHNKKLKAIQLDMIEKMIALYKDDLEKL